MEHSPESEDPIKRKLVFECPTCEDRVLSTFENGLSVEFTHQPWFNHVLVCCENDGFRGVFWVENEDNAEVAKQFMSYSLPFCDDEKLKALRREELGIEEIKEVELTPRQEKFIQNWGGFLQSTGIDLSDF